MKLDHAAHPGWLATSAPGPYKCKACGRAIRESQTSATGWRHAGRYRG